MGVSRKQSTPNFPKNEHFLPPDTRTYVWVSGGKKCLFFGKFGVLYFRETPVFIVWLGILDENRLPTKVELSKFQSALLHIMSIGAFTRIFRLHIIKYLKCSWCTDMAFDFIGWCDDCVSGRFVFYFFLRLGEKMFRINSFL